MPEPYNGWYSPLKSDLVRAGAIYFIEKEFRNSPVFSMFTDKAVRAIAEIAAGSLPIEENNE